MLNRTPAFRMWSPPASEAVESLPLACDSLCVQLSNCLPSESFDCLPSLSDNLPRHFTLNQGKNGSKNLPDQLADGLPLRPTCDATPCPALPFDHLLLSDTEYLSLPVFSR
jgi:hypothetical protein